MENLTEDKYMLLSMEEMNNITGGLSWNVWKIIQSSDCGTVEQRYNWFGNHGTDDIRYD